MNNVVLKSLLTNGPVENLGAEYSQELRSRFHPDHISDLAKSGLSEEMIVQANIRTVPPGEIDKRLGWHQPQVESAISFPYGKTGFERLRIFPPYIDKSGHKVKYLQRKDSGVHLYIPPGIAEHLNDPNIPIYIIEGEKKSLKGAQEGLCCAGLSGAWNFKEKGSDELLGELKKIPFLNREAFIGFDSDFASNRSVLMAAYRLGQELEKLGAKVQFVCLPSGSEKVGLDDFLCTHSLAEFQALPRIDSKHKIFKANGFRDKAKKLPTNDGDSNSEKYRMSSGRFCYVHWTQNGEQETPLCNFVARVIEEVISDNGAEKTNHFVIEGKLASSEPLPKVTVPALNFSSMNWITPSWGLGAIVGAGATIKDKLREAIQFFSINRVTRRVFSHTGWIKTNGVWAYLTAGGSIGKAGIEVQLEDVLGHYSLPLEIDDAKLKAAMRAALDCLLVADPKVTVPLWASVWLAPFSSFLGIDFCLWVYGVTGSMKTTLVALFLAFFGNFDRKHLPANWEDTVNALEKKAFLAKDVSFVIDDFAPAANGRDSEELERKAQRIVRSIGNLSARSRLKSDTSLRAAYSPRSLVISTGEQLPFGQSIGARIFAVPAETNGVNKELLTILQGQVDLFPYAMAGYISQLQPKLDQEVQKLKDKFKERRQSLQIGGHLRVPESVAHLQIGLKLGLDYAVSTGVLPSVQRDAYLKDGCKILEDLGKNQGQRIAEEKPTLRFLDVLGVLLTQKVFNFDLLNPERCIGWIDKDFVYLHAETAYHAVMQHCRQEGGFFPVKKNTLHRLLFEEGFLVKGNEGRFSTKVRLPNGGVSMWVLKMDKKKVAEYLPLPGESGNNGNIAPVDERVPNVPEVPTFGG